MNQPEISPATPDELAGQISCLQSQVRMLLLVLVVVSSTLTAYLYYESRVLGKDLDNTKPQALQIIQNYNKNVPQMQKLVQQLVAYGQTHPDFQPILINYGLAPATTNAAPKK